MIDHVPALSIEAARRLMAKDLTIVHTACRRPDHRTVECPVEDWYTGTDQLSGETCITKFKWVAKARRRPDGMVVVTELTRPADADCIFKPGPGGYS